jgi:four helix bundle protein
MARLLVAAIYHCTACQLPEDERYGLRSQMRRAAVSVAANIAEGCGRGTAPDMARFLRIALGSIAELRCLTDLCETLEYLDRTTAAPLDKRLEHLGAALRRLHDRVLRTKNQKPTT